MTEGGPQYDVAIVGAGDVGCAIARELARFELRLALIEAGRDVGAGTSKANTAILHTGFDSKPGTLDARLVARGHELLLAFADEVGIPLERTSGLLVAWNHEQLGRFPVILDNARRCGHDRQREVGLDELRRLEPRLAPGALGALKIPDAAATVTPSRRRAVAGSEARDRMPRSAALDRFECAGWGGRLPSPRSLPPLRTRAARVAARRALDGRPDALARPASAARAGTLCEPSVELGERRRR